MDVDPMEMVESKDDAAVDRSRVRLGARVAVTVALLATFLGICKVKDDNIVQAMQQAQADKLDRWNFYQARNIREEVASAALVQLRLSMAGAAASQQAGYRDAVAKYEAIVADQSKKKEELRLQAGEEQQTYDNLNYRDDQFNLSDTMIALAISLLAMTALTHKKWLYWVAILATLGGVVMGLSGLLGWHVHPDAISKLLS